MADDKQPLERAADYTTEKLREAQQELGKAYDKTKAWVTGDKSLWDKIKDGASDAVEGVKDAGKAVDAKTGGWLGDNKGLIIGGIAALAAVFGFEGGGFIQALIATLFLAVGTYVDKDNKQSLFGGIFRDSKQTQPTGPSPEVQPTPPTLNKGTREPDRTTVPSTTVDPNQKSTSFALPSTDTPAPYDISVQGERLYNATKIANLMHIVVDKNGKVTEIAMADEEGKFLRDNKDKDKKIIKSKINEDLSFTSKPDNNGVNHVDLTNQKNKDVLTKLREIGNVELQKSKGMLKSEELHDDRLQFSSLGNLSTPQIATAKLKNDKPQILGA